MDNHPTAEKGFTLIELVIVIVTFSDAASTTATSNVTSQVFSLNMVPVADATNCPDSMFT